ncbi:hypothetical protein ABTP68_19850, partial [Acinetobacter baumannii]
TLCQNIKFNKINSLRLIFDCCKKGMSILPTLGDGIIGIQRWQKIGIVAISQPKSDFRDMPQKDRLCTLKPVLSGVSVKTG